MDTSSATPHQALLFEVKNQVATLTFNNPDKRNVLDMAMREAMGLAVRQIRDDYNIRAVILTGAGGHFCSGGDLRAMASTQLDSLAWRRRMSELHEWVRDLALLDRPVIAAVDGAAAGAGFSFALLADFVLVTPAARFCMSFMKVGLIPDVAALYTLPRIVGNQRAKEIMLSARDVSAEEAVKLGIAMEMLPADQLLPRARQIASSFLGASPMAVSLVKRALAQPAGDLISTLDLEASYQALAASAPQHHEAVKQFLAKQPMPFQWPK